MHVTKGRNAHPIARTSEQAQRTHATGRMQAQKLIDLIDQSAPEEGVVDVHELDTAFANGSRRIALVDPIDRGAVVEAAVEGTADTTRRMSAVEADALVAVEIRSESTMRMSAIQESELVALITPVEVSVEAPSEAANEATNEATNDEPAMSMPVVRFSKGSEPRMALPLPVPMEQPAVDDVENLELAPGIEAPVRRGLNPWMIGGLIALAGAVAGLVAVLVA